MYTTWPVLNAEIELSQPQKKLGQPPRRVVVFEGPLECVVIGSHNERLALNVMEKSIQTPHYSVAFAFGCAVVLLCFVEGFSKSTLWAPTRLGCRHYVGAGTRQVGTRSHQCLAWLSVQAGAEPEMAGSTGIASGF